MGDGGTGGTEGRTQVSKETRRRRKGSKGAGKDELKIWVGQKETIEMKWTETGIMGYKKGKGAKRSRINRQ